MLRDQHPVRHDGIVVHPVHDRHHWRGLVDPDELHEESRQLIDLPRHRNPFKVQLTHEDPTCPTVSDLFPTSDWHERETREMFGIRFEGHPKPVKLLLSEPFEGQPLRKDFPLMSREAKPWPGLVEGEPEEDEE